MASKPVAPIEWDIDVSLLGQPSMIAMFLKIIVLSAALMGGLVIFLSFVLGDAGMIAPVLKLTAVSAAIISALLLFVVLVVFRNRMTMSYVVDIRGARVRTVDRRARLGSKAAIVAGVLTGKPGVLGAGLLAESSSDQDVAWRAVHSVACSPKWRTVSLANAWRTVMVLYCLPENYDEVAERAVQAVAVQPARAGGSPVPGLLLRSALVVVSCLPLFYLPYSIHVEAFLPFLILCFGLAAVWFLPVFGWVVIACLATVAGQATLRGAEPYRSSFSGKTMSRFALMSGDDWALLALALAGAALLIGLSLSLIRGRYASALAGDLAEMESDDGADAPLFCTRCGAKLDAAGKCASCDTPEAR